ncbi:hypothetical protein V8D89_004681 [Ganoderma adspersum]
MPPTNDLHIPKDVKYLRLPLFNEPLDPQTNQVPTEDVEINHSLTVKRLQDIPKDYGLPRSGTRPVLLAHLWKFSQYRAAPGHQRGDISSQRSAKTETARVIERQFGARVKASMEGKDLRDPPELGDAVITTFNTWVSGVNKRVEVGLPLATSHGQISELVDTDGGGAIELEGGLGEDGVAQEPNKAPVVSSSMFAVRRVENHVASITQILSSMQTQLSMIGTSSKSRTTGQDISTSPSHILGLHGWGNPSMPPSRPVRSCYLSHVPPVPESEISPSNLRTNVPNSPSVSFLHDLLQLFQESDLLTVNGHGIPIQHWPWFYKKKMNIKPGVWGFLVAEFERLGTEDAFWKEHSDEDGSRHNLKRICSDLKATHQDGSSRNADAALQFFNRDLSHPDAHGYFSYKRTGKACIMTKQGDIARKWRKLLNDHPEVAEAWAATDPGPDDRDSEMADNDI